MKTLIAAIFTAMLLVMFPEVSFSQAPPEGAPPSRGLQGKEITPENFNEVKSSIIKRIDDRLMKLTEEKTCVKAANNADELKKCRTGGPAQMRMQPPPK